MQSPLRRARRDSFSPPLAKVYPLATALASARAAIGGLVAGPYNRAARGSRDEAACPPTALVGPGSRVAYSGGQAHVIVTIDGPAGSGKSTTARKLAARLGIPYLDTGAMYRVVTLAALQDGVDLHDEQALAALAARDDYRLNLGPTHIRVVLRGRDVTEEIRSMRVNDHTPFIAGSPGVRRVLIERQRELARRLGSLVTEGRDQGTAAFPDAEAKFFLDADLEKRAERRLHDLLADGEEVTIEQVLANLGRRDQTDSDRAVAPLRVPDDAVRIDTTHMSIAEVLDAIIEELRRAGLIGQGTSADSTGPQPGAGDRDG
jgi:cytidylate kinase